MEDMAMDLLLIRHLWGVPNRWEDVFPQFKETGYRGIEAPVPPPAEQEHFRRLLDQHGLEYVAQIFTQGESVDEHIESFRVQAEAARTLRPRLINSQSGVDAWNKDESTRFFEAALTIERTLGLPITHETHRGRILFAPWIAARMLDRFLDLKLCADYSHWVCVCERLLHDQDDVLQSCARRTLHIHARVGYEEGPQVPDPRAPEYRRHLEAHERWWGWIWDAQEASQQVETTLTPEFGPPGYLHTLPYTNAPVVDLAAVCDWQAQRQAENFARRRPIA